MFFQNSKAWSLQTNFWRRNFLGLEETASFHCLNCSLFLRLFLSGVEEGRKEEQFKRRALAASPSKSMVSLFHLPLRSRQLLRKINWGKLKLIIPSVGCLDRRYCVTVMHTGESFDLFLSKLISNSLQYTPFFWKIYQKSHMIVLKLLNPSYEWQTFGVLETVFFLLSPRIILITQWNSIKNKLISPKS